MSKSRRRFRGSRRVKYHLTMSRRKANYHLKICREKKTSSSGCLDYCLKIKGKSKISQSNISSRKRIPNTNQTPSTNRRPTKWRIHQGAIIWNNNRTTKGRFRLFHRWLSSTCTSFWTYDRAWTLSFKHFSPYCSKPQRKSKSWIWMTIGRTTTSPLTSFKSSQGILSGASDDSWKTLGTPKIGKGVKCTKYVKRHLKIWI